MDWLWRTGKATGESILYLGAEKNIIRESRTYAEEKEVRKTRLKWHSVNERTMSARFNSCFAKLAVTQVYAPTNGADDEFQEEQLQRDVETTPRHDVLIVMGDLNATESATTMKVGRR